jgi:hypothetical protein
MTDPVDQVVDDPIDQIRKNIQTIVDNEQIWNALKRVLSLLPSKYYSIETLKIVLSGSVFFAEYGLFTGLLNFFEIFIEYLLMKTLRLTPSESSILFCGVNYSIKINVLVSLLSNDTRNAKGLALLKSMQRIADRNSFAHGLNHGNTATSESFILRRDIRPEYTAKLIPMNSLDLYHHIAKFLREFKEVSDCFNVTTEEVISYIELIVNDAKAHASRASQNTQSLTNAREAKKKARAQQVERSRRPHRKDPA